MRKLHNKLDRLATNSILGKKKRKINEREKVRKTSGVLKAFGDYDMVAFSKQCSAIIREKLQPKLKYSSSFTISCTISTHFTYRALSDSRASINLMPYSISLSYLRGIIEDVLVKVDKFTFPAKFFVLNMEANSMIPITPGRPFLVTNRTLINVQKRELTIKIQD
ncbi:hypothetical protein CDL12_05078 [Handroanthus impetiginosus]|uniref:Uncharacterized protein n=1 Tax=Handroanthus impetiginosus TaxID=429701 RepID=A0A2G9HXG9_9LAMI|nr:hypothetical protein CDL12_05078 [Handroanthus impetiginosus]